MTRLSCSLLRTSVALCGLSGCTSTRESGDVSAVLETTETTVESQTDTKIGVIDIMEVLRRTRIGLRPLARLQDELQEVIRQEEQYVAQYHRHREYYPFTTNPRYQAMRRATASIMPQVEAAAKALAEQRGFAIVLVKGTPESIMTTFYSADTVDLTDQAIEDLNRRFP